MNKLSAIANMKCPRCYEGNLFSTPNAFNIRHLHDMPNQCSHCGLKFTPEPGFYTGAMYVSYAFSVLLFIAYFFVFMIGFQLKATSFLVLYGLSLLLLFPYLFRYSRTLFLHLFYSYEPKAIETHTKT
jgi:uncharacterized protein (DUF983 family)